MPGAGVANPFPDQIVDNADITHPVKVGFEIDDTRTVSDVVLTVYTDYFRAYASGVPSGGSTSAAAGGAINQSSSSGGGYTNVLEGSHAHNWSMGGHSHSISLASINTSVNSPTSCPNYLIGGHNHSYTTVADSSVSATPVSGITDFQGNHQHTIPAHTHDITVSAHQHTNPAHTHEIQYGIYEYEDDGTKYYAPVKMYINDPSLVTANSVFGTRGDENTAVDTELSLIALYATGSPAVDVIGDGENTFYILPLATGHNSSGLVRILATVTVSYTDGSSGITVSSCYDSTRWGGKIMPVDALGMLKNDGAGNLTWEAAANPLPADDVGMLKNDGAGNLTWEQAASPLPADAHGLLHNDGAGNKTWLAESTFADAGHNHDAAYSAMGHNHDATYLGISATAADSTEWNGKTMPVDAVGVLTNDGAGNLSWDAAAGGGWDWGPNNDNLLINGNFDIWQRGTSSTGDVNGLILADRWLTQHVGATNTSVSLGTFTLGQTDVPGNPRYYERITFTAGANVGEYFIHSQKIEHVNTGASDAVTVSFYAKADANKSVTIEIEQKFGTGGSPSASVQTLVGKYNIGTNWTYVTGTVTLPSITGKTLGSGLNDCLQLNLWLDAGSNFNARTSSLGHQSGTFDIASVKLEYGDTATGFMPKTYAEELHDCQRYFYRFNQSGQQYRYICNGFMWNANYGIADVHLPVPMRIVPSLTQVSTMDIYDVAAGHACTVTMGSQSHTTHLRLNIQTADSLTVGHGFMLECQTAGSDILLDAEL